MQIALDRASGGREPVPDRLTLALDRESVRSYDADGDLKVEVANISKACVSPYLGREIPNFEALGLDPDKQYKLFRDPDELAKGADTFTGKPLLFEHIPRTAEKHPVSKVVGAVGTVTFEGGYLRARPLTIWRADAIDVIKSGAQREISCGYRYEPDMTPGIFEGERYDGVMRNISGNHVTLVAEGRAGPDVVIGDSMENLKMAKPRKTAAAKGLAGLKSVVDELTLAQDGRADGLKALLDALSEGGDILAPEDKDDAVVPPPEEGADADKPTPGNGAEAPPEGEAGGGSPEGGGEGGQGGEGGPGEAEGGAGDPVEAFVKQFLASKGLKPEDIAEFEAGLAKLAGGGEEAPGKPVPPAKDRLPAKPGLDEENQENDDMVTKPAMDAALAATARATEQRVLKAQRELREAERAVRPYVGELSMACDSDEQVLRAALKILKVEGADTIHASALLPVLKMQPTAAQKARAAERIEASFAMDAATADDFAKTFPGAARIGFA